MNRLSIVCAVIATASTSAASAADMFVQDMMPAEATTSIWTGFYAGLTVGGAYTDGNAERGFHTGEPVSTDVQNGLFPSSIDDDEGGFVGGVAVGYNQQFGNFVGGVEADFSLSSLAIENRFSKIDPSPNPFFNGVDTRTRYTTDIDSFGTVRARLGYAAGSTLFYGTGGFAFGDVTNGVNLTLDFPSGISYPGPAFPNAVGSWSEEDWLGGYTIGAGIEHKLTETISIKAEALYIDLEDRTVSVTDPSNFPGNQIDYKFENDMAVGRIGLNFAF